MTTKNVKTAVHMNPNAEEKLAALGPDAILPGVTHAPVEEQFIPILVPHYLALITNDQPALVRAGLDLQRKEELQALLAEHVAVKNKRSAAKEAVSQADKRKARLVGQGAEIQRDLVNSLKVLRAEGEVAAVPPALFKLGVALTTAPACIRWLNESIALAEPYAVALRERFGEDLVARMEALLAELLVALEERKKVAGAFFDLNVLARSIARAIARVIVNVRAIAARAFPEAPAKVATYRWPKLRKAKPEEQPKAKAKTKPAPDGFDKPGAVNDAGPGKKAGDEPAKPAAEPSEKTA